MNIQKIVNICKKTGTLRIMNTKSGVQWIGDSAAMYPLYDAAYFDERSICTTFNISEDAAEKMVIKTMQAEQLNGISLEDTLPDEVQAATSDITICSNGKDLLPCIVNGGIAFIDKKYFAPFDVPVEIYKREGYYALKAGFMIVGIVQAIYIDESFVQKLGDIYKMTNATMESAKGIK